MTMVRIIGAMMLVGLMVVALKVAAFVAIVISLMRWPKETFAVLAAILVINLVARYPLAAGIPAGLLTLIAVIRVMTKPPPDDPPQSS